MSEVERYNSYARGLNVHFEADSEGDWVTSDDYDISQSELTALKAELASEEKDHAELRDVVAALREENERLKAESFEGLYNEAIGERDALREELARVNREKNDVAYRAKETAERLNSMTISKATMRNKLKQRLTAAEQRNAELVEVLRRAPRGVPGFYDWQDKATALLKSMDAKPTESGASE